MKFTKGQWYADKNETFWLYCGKEGKDSEHLFRKTGASFRQWVPNDIRNQFTPASLTPDFSNAKVGDECFSAADGVSVITGITNGYYIDIEGNDYAFYSDGMYGRNDKYPTLFNSFAQFMGYWAEEGLKMKGEKK